MAGDPVNDLAERLKHAASAAIDDITPALADPGVVLHVTIELAVGYDHQITIRRAWIARGEVADQARGARVIEGPGEGDEGRLLRTEEQAERLYRAWRYGMTCAACGREFGHYETVYVETFEDARRRWGRLVTAPVGIECASDELRHAAASREPEHCAACGRAMYYRVPNALRRRALCSRVCRARLAKLRQAGG